MSKSKPSSDVRRRRIGLLFLFLSVCSSFYLFKTNTNQTTHVSLTNLVTHILSKEFANSNVVLSPLSIQLVLGLIAAGSEGQTLDQLLSLLEVNTIEELNALSSQLVSSIMTDASKSGGPRLAFVNGVWVDQTISLKDSFKQVVGTVYKAITKQVDFQSKADEVTEEVNLWAKNHTNSLIEKMLPPDAVDRYTRLILANALYFKGVWKEKFDPSLTIEHDFHLLDGSKVQVPFMTTMKDQLVGEYDGFKVLGLPYVHGEDKRHFTMYIYLPDKNDGLSSLIQKINSESGFLESHIPLGKVEIRKFLVPKFKISSGFEVSDSLKELGVVLPFKDGSLTKMVEPPNPELFVSGIHQKSFVEINEEGTEAAAITYSTVMAKSARFTYPDFVADHPFLFVIREDTTGAVLLMGQIADPSVVSV
uniref:serpin-ZX-like n=1 Tax=Erigeron canadensis TaxID=72917 RepID=UPI001CB94A34|nr:serpin-ZX-like [Erigeron canadensis]